MSSVASKSIHGIIWSAIERFSLQGTHFVIGVVLARLLSPSDFGMVGMLSIFLSVSQTFIDCGFSNALVRQKDVSRADFGTAFLVNFSISMIAFLVLFVIAPFVAQFYNMPELKNVMRTISITLVINALFTVHKVRLTRNVDFKTQSKASFSSSVISGILGIVLAYEGFGVWSLVYQTICNSVLNLFLLTLLLRWFPALVFNKSSFKCLFGFGSKIFVASIISAIYSNLYNIVIGKQFAANSLGYFTRADSFAKLPSQNVAGVLSRVTYPILSQLQDDEERLNVIYIRYLQVSCFVVFPLMMALIALAKPLILLLIGDKWIPSVLLLQILCVGLMFDPVCNINLNLLYVKGRSDLVLKLEVIKKIIAVVILVASLPLGLVGLCVGRALYGIVAMLLNMTYTRRFIGLSAWKQIKLILPALILSLIMAAVAHSMTLFNIGNGFQLVLGGGLGLFVYAGLAFCLKMDSMVQLFDAAKLFIRKK